MSCVETRVFDIEKVKRFMVVADKCHRCKKNCPEKDRTLNCIVAMEKCVGMKPDVVEVSGNMTEKLVSKNIPEVWACVTCGDEVIESNPNRLYGVVEMEGGRVVVLLGLPDDGPEVPDCMYQ